MEKPCPFLFLPCHRTLNILRCCYFFCQLLLISTILGNWVWKVLTALKVNYDFLHFFEFRVAMYTSAIVLWEVNVENREIYSITVRQDRSLLVIHRAMCKRARATFNDCANFTGYHLSSSHRGQFISSPFGCGGLFNSAKMMTSILHSPCSWSMWINYTGSFRMKCYIFNE